MRQVNEIIIHASDQALNYPSVDWNAPFTDAASITKFHVEHHGWSDNGYHWIIREDGAIEAGRPESVCGAHCKGHNKNSLGICLITQSHSGRVTLPAVLSMRKLIWHKLREHNLSPKDVYCHNNFDSTRACPGFRRKYLLDFINR